MGYKTDSLTSVLTNYIQKTINQKMATIQSQKQLIRDGEYDIVIGKTDDANVIQWKYNQDPKISIGICRDAYGVMTPLVALGGTNGDGDSRGYIAKSFTDGANQGLDIMFIGDQSEGEIAYLRLGKVAGVMGLYSNFQNLSLDNGLGGYMLLNATTFDEKLAAVDLADPDNPKEVGIVKQCISSVYADVIRGTYLSTENWEGATGNFIYMTQNIQYFKGGTTTYMSQGFAVDKDGYNVAMTCYGAANASGDNLGYISKDANGLNIFYIADKSEGEIAYLSLQKDPGSGLMQLYASHKLVLNVKLADTYIATAGTWNDKTQYLDTYGDMGGNTVTGSNLQSALTNNARIRMTSGGLFLQTNSSNQNNGIYCDKAYSDLILYYANTAIWGVYNGIDYIAMKSFGHTFLEYSSVSDHVTAYMTWDFSNATVEGLPAAKFG